MNKIEQLPSATAFTFPFHEPYQWYQMLREKSPIHRLSAGQWIVTSYDDAVALLQHPSCSHWGQDYETQIMLSPVQKAVAKTLYSLAPTNDLPYRKTIMHQLAAKNLKLEEDYIRDVGQKILRDLKNRDEIELMSDYAHPYTFQIISRFIGIPENRVEELSNLVKQLNGSYLECITGNKNGGAGDVFLEFLEEFIAYKRKIPGDDLCSLLLETTRGNNEEESFIISMLTLLFYAGHENMMNFFGNVFVSLHENRDLQNSLRQNPTLMNEGIDEFLRYDSPLQFIVLFTKEDIERNKKVIPSGSQLLICVGAANRDPKMFVNPNELDMLRKPAYLSFGAGAFRCIGAKLARLEGIIGINNFLSHVNSFTLLDETISWNKANFVQRGPDSLNLKVNWND